MGHLVSMVHLVGPLHFTLKKPEQPKDCGGGINLNLNLNWGSSSREACSWQLCLWFEFTFKYYLADILYIHSLMSPFCSRIVCVCRGQEGLLMFRQDKCSWIRDEIARNMHACNDRVPHQHDKWFITSTAHPTCTHTIWQLIFLPGWPRCIRTAGSLAVKASNIYTHSHTFTTLLVNHSKYQFISWLHVRCVLQFLATSQKEH